MKRLGLLTITVLAIFAAHSQSNTDTVCIPVTDAKALLASVERAKLTALELEQKTAQAATLQRLVRSKDTTLQQLQNLTALQGAQLINWQMKDATFNEQLQLSERYTATVLTTLRKQKRKTFFIGAAGVLCSTGLTILLLTK